MSTEIVRRRICDRFSRNVERGLPVPAADVRGRRVLEAGGESVGEVDDILLDEDEWQVRFVVVRSQGLLGFGATRRIVPVDGIESVDEHELRLQVPRETFNKLPQYGDGLSEEEEEDLYAEVFALSGFQPYWSDGYHTPAFPPTAAERGV